MATALRNVNPSSMLTHPWLATFPDIAIFVTTLGINLLGDGLRGLLDPHQY